MPHEMQSLYLVQSLLGWYAQTQGERSVFQDHIKDTRDFTRRIPLNMSAA